MPESEFISCLNKSAGVDRILESTANAIEAIGRKKGGDYDNLTAAIIEMNQNSKLKPKMTKLAKILLVILSILLIISIGLNVWQNYDSNGNKVNNASSTPKRNIYAQPSVDSLRADTPNGVVKEK